MIVLVLTGSIGMGKSTTARLFEEAGAAVWDADVAVHALYERGGAAVDAVEAAFPGVVVDGAVDRARLSARLQEHPEGFSTLEAIVHPLVMRGRLEDLAEAERRGVRLAVLDIPLLFETGGDAAVDAVVVVTAAPEVQAERVLARPGMTRERFEAILARQTPDADKRRRADFIVETDRGLEAARTKVREIVGTILAPGWTSPRRGVSPEDEAIQ